MVEIGPRFVLPDVPRCAQMCFQGRIGDWFCDHGGHAVCCAVGKASRFRGALRSRVRVCVSVPTVGDSDAVVLVMAIRFDVPVIRRFQLQQSSVELAVFPNHQ